MSPTMLSRLPASLSSRAMSKLLEEGAIFHSERDDRGRLLITLVAYPVTRTYMSRIRGWHQGKWQDRFRLVRQEEGMTLWNMRQSAS